MSSSLSSSLLSSIVSSSLPQVEDDYVRVTVQSVAIGLLVGCLVTFGSAYLPDQLQLPSIVIFAFGLGLGAIPSLWDVVRGLDPEIILLVFLPPILFQSGLVLNWHVFKRVAFQSIILAGPGVLINAGITTLGVKFCFVDYNWSWTEALLLGGALSATDPVATIATIKKLGCAPKISVLIEGEALLNDGSAYVLFIVVYDILATNTFSFSNTIKEFCTLTIGGPLFGLAFALVTYLWLRLVRRQPVLEIGITVFSVFTTMFVSEYIHASGVLAVVTFGLFMAFRGKYGYSPGTSEPNILFWEQMEFFINSILFFFAGVIVIDELLTASGADFLNVLILFAFLEVARFIGLIMMYPILRFTGYGFSLKMFALVWSAGLRGGVALSLGLMVSSSTDLQPAFRSQFIRQVSGSVLLTAVINGIISKFLYPMLKFDKPNTHITRIYEQAIAHVELDLAQYLTEQRENKDWKHVDWDMVTVAIPALVKETDISLTLQHTLSWSHTWEAQLRNINANATGTPFIDPRIEDIDSYSRSSAPAPNILESTTNAAAPLCSTPKVSEKWEPQGEADFNKPVEENFAVARSMFINAVRAHYQEQFEESRLNPHNVSTLVNMSDHAAEAPDRLFVATRDAVFSHIVPSNLPIIKRFLRIPFVRFLGLYLLLRKMRASIQCAKSVCDAHIEAAIHIEKETGVSFKAQVDWFCDQVDFALDKQRKQWPVLFALAETALATTFVLMKKRSMVHEIAHSGFLDDKTRDIIQGKLNKTIGTFRTAFLVRRFWKICITSLGGPSILAPTAYQSLPNFEEGSSIQHSDNMSILDSTTTATATANVTTTTLTPTNTTPQPLSEVSLVPGDSLF
ncbi:sodium:proton antiporter [Pelomyxa schiedti]|nr:sodium:proton antiporter [Pelomyxa schiedti]